MAWCSLGPACNMPAVEDDFVPVPRATVRALPEFTPAGTPEPADLRVVPTYALYSNTQIVVAAVLGSAIAGTWLMLRNLQHRGRSRVGWLVFAAGVLVTAGSVAIAWNSVRFAGTVVQLVPVLVIANHTQRQAFVEHVALGGRRASWWFAIGAAIATLVIVGTLIVGGAFLHAASEQLPRVPCGTAAEVLYRDGATEDEARSLARHLEPTFGASEASILLEHGAEQQPMVGFIFTGEAATDPFKHLQLHLLAESLSHEVYADRPVDITLNTPELERRVLLPWAARPRSYDASDVEVVYTDGANEAEARSVAETLRAEGYLAGDEPLLVAIWHSADPMIAFVVPRAAMGDGSRFRHLGREVAKAVYRGAAIDVLVVAEESHETVMRFGSVR
jgi:hypothetical protein